MFVLGILKKGRKFRKPLNFLSENRRLKSTKENVWENIQTVQRRYTKRVIPQALKAPTENFVKCLFTDTIDKSFFQYPTVFRRGDTNTVLEQTAEVEAFFSRNLKDELTEEIITKLRELELFGLSVSQEYGGAGYTDTEVKFLLECAGLKPRIAQFLGYHDVGCKVLERYGNEEQKRKYLPRLAEGKCFITFAYLENGPLINFSKFEGTAIFQELEKQILLNTDKKWVHSAESADVFLVVVRTALLNKTDTVQVKFNVFIVDRETPGVTVHKLNYKNAQDYDLYDVTFKDVIVPFTNVLGDLETDGFDILKFGLSHASLNQAVQCCCFMKLMMHYISQFIQENDLSDPSVRGNYLVHENLASLCLYTYALESVIYMLTGRFDTYEKPDFFHESLLVKIFAVDMLQIAIKKFMDIVGRETFKGSGILEDALQSLHYFMVFDENIEYLKMLVAADAFVVSAPKLRDIVLKWRKWYDFPWEALKINWSSEDDKLRKWQSKHNYRMEFPVELTNAAIILEKNCGIVQRLVEYLFTFQGSVLVNQEHYVNKFAEIAAYLYALTASLARASNSLCYDFEGHKNDALMAQAFSCAVDAKIKFLANENLKYGQLVEYYRILGKHSFNAKEYPVEHPLSRSY